MKNTLVCILVFVIYTVNSIGQKVSTQNNFDVTFYLLDLELNNTSTYLKGKTTIGFNILVETDSILLNLGNQLNVSKVRLGGNSLQYQHSNDELYVISDKFKKNQYVEVEVFYEGDGDNKNKFGALFNRTYQQYGSFTYSLTEPFYSKYWYPCKEVLNDKADSVFVYITVPKRLKVGANGILKDVVTTDEDHAQYRWESRYPTSYYLISVAIGEYLNYTDSVTLPGTESIIPIVNLIYNSEDYLKENKSKIDTTAYLMKLFSSLFGKYPFSDEKYGHCLVPAGGGMEHQTMTTLGNFNFDLVSHELAHQWFGNWVTCSTWSDIWINEGFASYAEYLANEFSGNSLAAKSWMEYAQHIVVNSEAKSIYVSEKEIHNSSRIFNYATTYKKGAAMVHMIRYELQNDSIFFNTLKTFLQRYSFGNASAEDFKNVLEEISGRSFSQFFKQWYYGTDYPVLDVQWYQQEDSLHIQTQQKAWFSGEKPSLFKFSVQYKVHTSSGDTIINSKIDSFNNYEKVQIQDTVKNIYVDPENYLLKKVNSVKKVDSFSLIIN